MSLWERIHPRFFENFDQLKKSRMNPLPQPLLQALRLGLENQQHCVNPEHEGPV